MRLVENIPLDTHAIADLLHDPEDLFLVWPCAKQPFDHGQWEKALDPSAGNLPFLVYNDGTLIGHAALCVTPQPHVYSVSYLYISPEFRSKGLGKKLISLLEKYALEELAGERLVLKARSYNPQAVQCYLKCGFQVEYREETLIRMSKTLGD